MNDQSLSEKLRQLYAEFKSAKAMAGPPHSLVRSRGRDGGRRQKLAHPSSALEHFEISHPTLALLIKQVLDTLNQLGI